MGLKIVLFAAPVALFAAAPAWAGDELLFGPPPEWVEPRPVIAEPIDESTLPVRWLRMDWQVRMEGGRQTTYSAVAFKIQSSPGLNAGNLSLPWRPETDDLIVHRIAIRRGAETIDVLASGQTFTTLRREQSLDQATLDGVLTANMFPEDLQVGDILEIVTSVSSSDPVFAGHSEQIIGPLNVPIDNLYVRLMWPSPSRMRLAKTDDLPAWRRSTDGGYEVAELELENLEPIPTPRGSPLRYSMVRFIQASDFASWADLAAIQAPLYVKAAQVPTDGPLRAEIERIRQSSPDPAKRAEAALQLVQRRVRYVALAMGEGGYVPADATLTWSRRFGDCKGKTALLLAILGELGIKAEGVLANTVLGDSLPGRLPSVGAFDHVLVRATIGGREYWLDGTRTGDTTLDQLTVPYFDWGLPLRASGAELVEMLPPPLEEPSSDISIHMDASAGVRAPVPTRIELVLRHDQAVSMNLALAGQVGQARDRALREYWRRRFDFVEPHSVGFLFDENTREARLTLEGKATLDWNGVWYETDETGLGYQADFSREPGPNSDAPFSVAYPFFTRTRQTFVLPPGFVGPTSANGNVDETLAGVHYRRRMTVTGNTLIIEATERSLAPEFEAKNAPAFQKRLRELWSDAVYLRMPDTYSPTAADLALLTSDMSGDAGDLIDRAIMVTNGGKPDAAIAMFDRAAELDPRNAFVWANRGIALLEANRFEEARASFDRAAEVDPRNYVVFNGRGRLAERQRDWQGAADAYATVLEIDSTNEYAMIGRANMQVALQKPELALAEAAAALKLNPRMVSMYGLRTFILIQSGKPDEAAAEVEIMLAALQGDDAARDIAIQAYSELGMPEKARPLADRAVEDNRTPLTLYNRSKTHVPADSDGPLTDLNEALRLDSSYQPALMARAGLHFANGRFDEALADTAAALELNPQWPEVNLLRANIFTRMGRRDDALAEAAAVAATNPDNSWAQVAAGKIYAQFGRREDALAAVGRGIAIDEVPAYYIDRAQVRDPSDLEGQMDDVEQALRLAPSDETALHMKAVLLSERGEHAAAAEAIALAMENQPVNPGSLNTLAIALARAGRLDEAERSFVRARELADNALTLNAICYPKALANVALERALEECDESLRLRPDFAPSLDSRGAVLLRLGRYEEAIRDFDRALEQAPGMASTRHLRAVARLHQGDFAAARADAEAAREAAPDAIARLERAGFVVKNETSQF
jgi:tetratricopeptide (TPR) repeat protein